MEEFYTVEDGKIIVAADNGFRVRCLPVADLLMRAGTGIVDPPEEIPPTYEVEDGAGEKSRHEHDAVSIADPKTGDEDRAAWAAYLGRKARRDAIVAENAGKRGKARARLLALEGIQVEGLPDLHAWARERREVYGMAIEAETDEDLLIEFVGQRVIRSVETAYRINAGIFRASGMDEGTLDQIEDRFRLEMGWPGRTKPEADPEKTQTAAGAAGRGVVDGAAVRGARRPRAPRAPRRVA